MHKYFIMKYVLNTSLLFVLFEEGELPQLLAVLAEPVVLDALLPHLRLSLPVDALDGDDIPAQLE